MTNKEKFFKKHKDFKELGSFLNEYNEEFVIYRFKKIKDLYLLTGDELGWEPWLIYTAITMKGTFIFSKEEAHEITKIISWEMAK